MKHTYYISYMGNNETGTIYGSLQMNTENKIETFPDLESARQSAMKECGATQLSIISFYKLKYSPIPEVGKPSALEGIADLAKVSQEKPITPHTEEKE